MRKRDKRVQAYKKVLEERAAFNRQKQEQNRLEQIRRRQQELQEIKENSRSCHNDDYEEQLKQLEQEYSSDEEYYDDEDEASDGHEVDNIDEADLQDEEEEVYLDDLYCVACNKSFKNEKAFANHETSKKHRDNVEKLKLEMQEEEDSFNQEEDAINDENEVADNDAEIVEIDDAMDLPEDQINDDSIDEDLELSQTTKNKSRKNKNKKESRKSKLPAVINSDDEELDTLTKKTSEIEVTVAEDDHHEDDWNNTNKKAHKKSKNKSKVTKKQTNPNESTAKVEEQPVLPEPVKVQNKPTLSGVESDKSEHICVTCKSKFDSKNKLFSHLKITNHGVYIPKSKTNEEDSGRTKKGKGKKK